MFSTMITVERIVKYVELSAAQASAMPIAVTIENGREVDPMRIEHPGWLAISSVDGPSRTATHVLYFLRADGSIIDFNQRRSLEDAVVEVAEVVPVDTWHTCSVNLGDAFDRIPRESL
jgi:hypothetical protein